MIFLKWEEPVEPNGLITQYEVGPKRHTVGFFCPAALNCVEINIKVDIESPFFILEIIVNKALTVNNKISYLSFQLLFITVLFCRQPIFSLISLNYEVSVLTQ